MKPKNSNALSDKRIEIAALVALGAIFALPILAALLFKMNAKE